MDNSIVFKDSWNNVVNTPPSKFREYLDKFGVEGIEQRGSKFIFRCPVCGDSDKVKTKKRGFLITNSDGKATIGCHNCGYKNSFNNFLKSEKRDLYRKWIEDVYVGISLDSSIKNNVSVEVATDITSEEIVDYSLFKPLAIFNNSEIYRKTMEFVCSRKIPKKFARHFMYCESGRYANRVIIPHYNKDMSFKHFEARDLRPNPMVKYLYPSNWKPNNYNLPNLDLSRDYFIFEGVIDSLFLDNSVACGGAQKYKYVFEQLHESAHSKAIIFADGDKDGFKVAFKFLKKGYRVVKWNSKMLKWKKGVYDLNGLILSGFFAPEDFNEDGTLKTSAIMPYVIEPSMGEILMFQIDALGAGINNLD